MHKKLSRSETVHALKTASGKEKKGEASVDTGNWEMDTQVHRKVTNASGSLLRGPQVHGDLRLLCPQGTMSITAALG